MSACLRNKFSSILSCYIITVLYTHEIYPPKLDLQQLFVHCESVKKALRLFNVPHYPVRPDVELVSLLASQIENSGDSIH